MERDLHSDIDDRVALANLAIAANGTSAGVIIDTQGFESLEYLVQSGDITDGAYALLVEDGDDSGLSDAAAVPAALTLGALTGFVAADDDEVRRVGVISKKRFQRLSIVATGVTVGVDSMSAVAVLGHPKRGPVAQ